MILILLLFLIGGAILFKWVLTVDEKKESTIASDEYEDWLIKNRVAYFKSAEGIISVDVNKIPAHLFKEYHDLTYKLSKK